MDNILKYKGYFTKIEYDAGSKVLFGKIEGINSLINFESENTNDIESAFHKAVDDYLSICAEKGIEPEKAYNIFQKRG